MSLNLNPSTAHEKVSLDTLKGTIKNGSWAELDVMCVGEDIYGNKILFGQSSWDIFNHKDEGKLNLVFTQHGKVLERIITNQIKCTALVMVHYSQKKRSLKSITENISLLKCLAVLMLEFGVNDFSLFDEELYTKLGSLPSKRDIYDRHFLTALNFISKHNHLLPFALLTKKKLSLKSVGAQITPSEQTVVIPPRIYFSMLAMFKQEIDNITKNSKDFIQALDVHADYLNRRKEWVITRLRTGTKSFITTKFHFEAKMKALGLDAYSYKDPDLLWEQGFNKLSPPLKRKNGAGHIDFEDMPLVSIGDNVYDYDAFRLFLFHISSICAVSCMALSGMRADELWRLPVNNGAFKEYIYGKECFFFNTSESKLSPNSQTKDTTFITTKTGYDAYQALLNIHQSYSNCGSFRRLFLSFSNPHFTKALSKNGLKAKLTLFIEKNSNLNLSLTHEDIKYLNISDPSQSKNKLNELFNFSTHQLRRSLSYYLIGYELADFPQLKQQLGHYSMYMTRWYANNASHFNSFNKELDDQRCTSQAAIYLRIYKAMANNERIAGGKGKSTEHAITQLSKNGKSYFQESEHRGKLSLEYWEIQIRNKRAHLHAIAPGMYCTNSNCEMRINIELAECVNCEYDYIESAAYAETARIEATRNLILADDLNDLTPSLASKYTMQIKAAEQIMTDLNFPFEPFDITNNVNATLINTKNI